MLQFIHVPLEHRAVVLKDGLPVRALAPGRHLLWGLRLGVHFYDTTKLFVQGPAELRAMLPEGTYAEVRLAKRERGVLLRDGRPVRFLRPGVHRYFTVDPGIELRRYSVDEPMPELTDELVAVIPKGEYILQIVPEHARGLMYIQGRFAKVLAPGKYSFWIHPEARMQISNLDMRREQLQVVGQELMTRDKVSLRLNLTADMAVEDPALAVHTVASPRDAVYMLIQLAVRQYVGSVSLDELLEGRDAMARHLEETVVPKAKRFGVVVSEVGVKDIVLPGDMKALLNRVIEAEKEAAANVILRREETAATRSLANTAKVMADHPVLLRLKELEALKDIAEQIHEVRVVVGADGLDGLLPAQLLDAKR